MDGCPGEDLTSGSMAASSKPGLVFPSDPEQVLPCFLLPPCHLRDMSQERRATMHSEC